jgi:transposase
MSEEPFGVGPADHLPEALWLQLVRVLPPPKARKKEGRPRMDDRQAMPAILSGWRTGCQGKALPRS